MVSIQILITADTATTALDNVIQALQGAISANMKLGATAMYAGYVEFGTRKMGAQPYLRPAADAFTPDIGGAYAMGLMNGDILGSLETVGENMESMARAIVAVDTGYLRSTIYHTVE